MNRGIRVLQTLALPLGYVAALARTAYAAYRSKYAEAPKEIICLKQVISFGAGDEARTRYLHLGKVALYQMSYARICPTGYADPMGMVPPVGIEPTTRGFSVLCSTN